MNNRSQTFNSSSFDSEDNSNKRQKFASNVDYTSEESNTQPYHKQLKNNHGSANQVPIGPHSGIPLLIPLSYIFKGDGMPEIRDISNNSSCHNTQSNPSNFAKNSMIKGNSSLL